MKRFFIASALACLSVGAFASETEVEAAPQQQQKLDLTMIEGKFTILAPPSRELLSVLESIDSTKANEENSLESFRHSLERNTNSVLSLIDAGTISAGNFEINSTSQLVPVEAAE